MITEHEALRLGLDILPTNQKARQVDGTLIPTVGKVIGTFTRGSISLPFAALVSKTIANATFLAGMDFMKQNKIMLDIPRERIIIQDKYYINCNTPLCPTNVPPVALQMIKLDTKTTLFPGDYSEIKLSPDLPPDQEYLVESREENKTKTFTPQVCQSVGQRIRFINKTREPIILQKDLHLLQVRLLTVQPEISVQTIKVEENPLPKEDPSEEIQHYLKQIQIDPDNILTK